MEVVRAVRRGRDAPVADDRTQHLQLDGGGPGPEHHPHPGGLGLGLRHLLVAAGLGAGPGGQPVGEETATRGALQVEGAAQQVAGDGRGDQAGGRGRGGGIGAVRVVHALSLSTDAMITTCPAHLRDGRPQQAQRQNGCPAGSA